MSTRACKRPVKGYVRDPRRRKMVLDVDLNVIPSIDNRVHERATTSRGDFQVVEVSEGDVDLAADGRLPAAPIDVEAFDDDILISSPRRFTQARTHSRRNRVETVVIDEDSCAHRNGSDEPTTKLTLNSFVMHGRNFANREPIICEFYDLENSQGVKRKKESLEQSGSAKGKEPVFSCPICMGPFVEETSTICGHIFCNKCIKAAMGVQKKCPTCRRKLTSNQIHRVYLPSTN